MQYLLTEQELEEIRGNPKAQFASVIAEHRTEIRKALETYSGAAMRVIRSYVPPDQIEAVEKELMPSVMELAKVFNCVY